MKRSLSDRVLRLAPRSACPMRRRRPSSPQHKQVPAYAGSVWYYFGGVSLFLFIVQVITRHPADHVLPAGRADRATSPCASSSCTCKFGWLVRSIHTWSANLMIFTVFVHMFSVFFTKAFRKPRELTWFTGLVLLGLCMGFGFSGYLLPWNTLAYFATKVGTAIAATTPFVGQGRSWRSCAAATDVGAETLTRFFGLHVAVMPALFTVMLGAHLMLVQIQGMHEPHSWETAPPEKKNATCRSSPTSSCATCCSG